VVQMRPSKLQQPWAAVFAGGGRGGGAQASKIPMFTVGSFRSDSVLWQKAVCWTPVIMRSRSNFVNKYRETESIKAVKGYIQYRNEERKLD
jgi:hypothetical protein